MIEPFLLNDLMIWYGNVCQWGILVVTDLPGLTKREEIIWIWLSPRLQWWSSTHLSCVDIRDNEWHLITDTVIIAHNYGHYCPAVTTFGLLPWSLAKEPPLFSLISSKNAIFQGLHMDSQPWWKHTFSFVYGSSFLASIMT